VSFWGLRGPIFYVQKEDNMSWVWAPLSVILIAIVAGALTAGQRKEESNITVGFVIFSIVAMLALGMVIGKILF